MMESRLKKTCPACGTTSISNMKMRKYKCHKCKSVFEVPVLKEVKTGIGLKLKVRIKTEQQVT